MEVSSSAWKWERGGFEKSARVGHNRRMWAMFQFDQCLPFLNFASSILPFQITISSLCRLATSRSCQCSECSKARKERRKRRSDGKLRQLQFRKPGWENCSCPPATIWLDRSICFEVTLGTRFRFGTVNNLYTFWPIKVSGIEWCICQCSYHKFWKDFLDSTFRLSNLELNSNIQNQGNQDAFQFLSEHRGNEH